MPRRVALAALVVLALVTAAYLAQRLLFAPQAELSTGVSSAAAVQSPARQERQRILVHEVRGQVEFRRGDGPWRPLHRSEELNQHDEIRTSVQARALIELGPSVTVELAPRTQVNIAELSATLSRVRLQDGRIASTVQQSEGFRFRVQVQGSGAVAETEAGRFTVMRRGSGPVAVAAEEGSVSVAAAGTRVEVGAGEQSLVVGGLAPTPPSRIPTSLLLKLGRPPPSRQRATEARVTGQTTPGAALLINGEVAPVAGNGEFSITVALHQGENEIVVEVEDVVGRRKQEKLPKVTVDATPPGLGAKVLW